MRRILLWLGVLLYVAGFVVVLANVVMSYRGLSTTYPLGDRSQLQFLLAPIWHLGLTMVVMGVAILMLWRRLHR